MARVTLASCRALPPAPPMPRPVHPNRRHVLRLAAAVSLAAGTCRLAAQPRFPQRPVTLIVPFAPGGIADLSARAVGEALAARLGQPVVIDNRPGAGAIVAAQAVRQAAPDGHTLLLLSNANAVSVGLMRRLPYDPERDFTPVGTIGFFDLGLFGATGGRHATLREALAAARAQPGRVSIGTIAIGSTQHLAARLFEARAGVDLLVVPYKGTPALMTALRAGEVDLAMEIVGPMLSQLGPAPAGAPAGLRALAVAADHRLPPLPTVPTVAEAGVGDFSVASWNGLAAPAGTPPAVIELLNRALREALADPAVSRRLAPLGVRLAADPSAAALRALLHGEIARWGAVIKAAKIEAE